MEIEFTNKQEQTIPRIGDYLYVEWDEEHFIYQVVLGIKDSQDHQLTDKPYFLIGIDNSFPHDDQSQFTVCQSYQSLEELQIGKQLYKPTAATITKIFPHEKTKLIIDN